MINQIQKEIRSLANTKRVKTSAWFFKTGPGQYGAGDKFLGLNTPQTRLISKKYKDLSLADIQKLIKSPFHEERSIALQILVHQYPKNPKTIYEIYLKNTKYINNWDLVDISAPKIVGEYLLGKPLAPLLKLAKSKSLWERRIAILATFAFIYKGDPRPTLRISKLLLKDKHDLIHKAAGWMLREVGKRCGQKYLTDFLDANLRLLPRTTLRYAIERLPANLKTQYMRS